MTKSTYDSLRARELLAAGGGQLTAKGGSLGGLVLTV